MPRFLVTDRGVAPEYVARVRAVLLSLGRSATACGRTAAVLRGWALFTEPRATVEIAVPHGRAVRTPGDAKVQERRRLEREQLIVLADTTAMWVTTALQTAVDCAVSLPLLQAVVLCDSALRARDVTVEELVKATASLPGVRDVKRARRVVELCDPSSGSVLESVLRVRMMLDGITGFRSQVSLRDAGGGHVLRVDFCFAGARLVVEADGQKWHQDVVRDRRLDNALAVLGWRVLRYTWAEVVHDADRVLAEIAAALGATTSGHLAPPGAVLAA